MGNERGIAVIGSGYVGTVMAACLADLGHDVVGVDICRPKWRRRWGPLGVGVAAVENMARRVGNGLASADCLISPDLAGASYVRFSRREELIARGIKAAEEKLPLIQAALAPND